ncbi:Scavenger receptor [Nesidiocoris tenuis]|uniref:Scavenger receptor n=1 Tax=Nesidiocoris tenuis TaxID=355587 RepID=A0ABN7APY8_9HEMI|nr:Scavenger receptor [Nesidiocoris tenuis]
MIGAMSCYTKLAIVGGLVLTAVSLLWPTVLTTLMYKNLKLAPGSKSFQHWKETPVPMYIDIYFHNWTNPQEVYTATPHFNQMGPYRFYEKRTKVKLVWNDNGTVSYRQTRHWYFDETYSNGTLTDKITTVNMIAATAAHKLRYHQRAEQIAMSWGLTSLKYEVEMVKTVKELMFEGYSDHILSILKYHPEYNKKVLDKFGWFYKRNGSDEIDGIFNMDTGANDLTQVGKIRTWNGENRSDFFPGKCGEIAGTSGEVFPPWLTTKDRLGLFSGDLCRTIYLVYNKEASFKGINGLEFIGSYDNIDSGIVDPETSCYATGEPTPLGLHNITSCRYGAPFFVSYPHFYLGDPWLTTQVSGLQPNEDLHRFSLTVEPTLGVPLDVKGRFQVNIMLEPNRHYLLYRDLPGRVYMPLLWFDQRASLTDPLADEVRLMVFLHNLSTSAATALLVVGIVMAASGITWACRDFNKTPPNKLLHYTVYTIAAVAASTSRLNTPKPTPRASPRASPTPSSRPSRSQSRNPSRSPSRSPSIYLRPSPRPSPRSSPCRISPSPSPQPRPNHLTVDWR